MTIILEAQGEMKPIEGNDMEDLKMLLERISLKYDLKVEINNFHIDYRKNHLKQ